ncbi:TetR/AcrR family transcriptional regulator [Kribbella sp. NPDC020789]
MSEKRPVRVDRTETIMRTTLELAQDLGYAKLSIEAVAARAGVGKHTVYRRWPSKGMLFHDSLMALQTPVAVDADTGDLKTDLRTRMHATVDMMTSEPWGPLYGALLGETQHDPVIAESLNERFIRPLAAKTVEAVRAAQDKGQVAAGFDPDVAMEILSGPIYFRLLVTKEPLTYEFVDRVLEGLFIGLEPRAGGE